MASESCGHDREVVPEALTGVRVSRVLSREIGFRSQAPKLFPWWKATPAIPRPARGGGPGAVEDPERARMHLAREPGDPVIALRWMVPTGTRREVKDAIRR